jgi:hypothetical protein
MLARLRLLLVKTPVIVALGFVVCYLVFGYLLFPPLAKWAATKFIADKTGHVLSLGEVKLDPLRLSLSVKELGLVTPLGQPLMAFDELFLDFQARSLFKWAYTFSEIKLIGPKARLELLQDGSLNWTPFLEAFKDQEEDKDDELPRLLIDHVALQKGEVDFIDRKVRGGFETRMEPIAFELHDLSTLPEHKGDYTLSSRTRVGATVRWKGSLALNPVLATGQLAVEAMPLSKLWPYVGTRLNMLPPAGTGGLSLDYRLGYADKHLSLNLDRMGVVLEQLALQGKADPTPAIVLERLALTGGSVDLDKRLVRFAGLAVAGGHVHIRREADGSVDLQDWFASGEPATSEAARPAVPVPSERPGLASADSTTWNISLDHFALDGISLRLLDEVFLRPHRLETENVRLGFKLDAKLGAGVPQVVLDDMQASLGGNRLFEVGLPQPPLAVGDIILESGKLDLAASKFEARLIALDKGQLEACRRGDGRLNLVEFMRLRPAKETGQRLSKVVAREAKAWQYRIDSVELRGWQVAARDETVSPPARMTLDGIEASLRGLSQDTRQALPLKLGFRVKEGGRFGLEGKMVPATGALDARVHLLDLQVKPTQPYLAKLTRVEVVSGRISTQGRLRYGKTIDYAGGFSIDDLLVNEAGTQNRLLSWRRLGTDKLKLSDKMLDIDALALDSLGLKLVIHQDKSINFKQALSKEDLPSAAPVGQAAAETPGSGAKPEQPAAARSAGGKGDSGDNFKVVIDRVNLKDGVMDFADLSLALPFGTRIHQLGGFLDGIASEAGGRPAQLSLEGQVDDYGQARANGAINLFDPTGFTDIKVVFRNVEMNRLTPYSATFAGRRIASGKLSLDLEYKIQARQLAGENQIIMDKLTLGERVESPTAKNLPLDLAIAILSDSEGRIDLGLPVSGSLDDPQFSYGKIIWKAIVNVITKIVTAPFRALGKLLGGGAEQLENLAFDPGSARLSPPERETLKNLAQALEKRPKLALQVQGTWDPEADRRALQESRVRAAVAGAMGIKLPEGEAAPPVPMTNPKAQESIEATYAERLGKDGLKAFKARYYKANPERQKRTEKMLAQLSGVFKGDDKPLSDDERAAMQDKDLHVLLYQGLIKHEQIGADALQVLARQRAQTIVDEMVVVNKVPKTRVQLGKVEALQGDGKRVGIKLSLVVAATPSTGPAEALPAAVPLPADTKPQLAQ